jgi:uncharacterized protein (DUF2147 family)
MRRFTVSIFALTSAVMIASAAVAAAPASINGRWITPERDSIIEIAPCGSFLCGRIAKYLKTPPQGVDQKDTNNPNKALRVRKLMGTAVLHSLIAGDKEWRGKIYDPRNGRSYRSVVFLQKNGNLSVKGCLGPICQSQTWTPG